MSYKFNNTGGKSDKKGGRGEGMRGFGMPPGGFPGMRVMVM